MDAITIILTTILAKSQPLFVFLGLAGSVPAVQLAVLEMVAFSIIGVLILSMNCISKMVNKSGNGAGLEDCDDEKPQGLAVSKDDNAIPKKTAADLVEKHIDNTDIDAAINIAKIAIGPAKAALAKADEADKAFTKLEEYCADMSRACEEYHSISIDHDGDADEIAAVQANKNQVKQKCIALSKNIQSIIPIFKAAHPALLIAKKDALYAIKLVRKTSFKLEKLIEIQGQACLDAQSNKNPNTIFKAKAEYVNSAKRAADIEACYQPLTKVTDRLQKICAYSALSLGARDAYKQVDPPKSKNSQKK